MMRIISGFLLSVWLTVAALPAAAQDLDKALSERVLGDPAAPIEIIEYASFTCPHCATFHNTALPKLKSEYIDSGKAKLVFRDFPLDGLAARAGMMARCVPEDRYFAVVDMLFKQQMAWATAQDPLAALSKIGRLAGLSPDMTEKCLNDEALLDGILKIRLEGQEKYDVRATPTILVNGKKADSDFDSLDATLKSLTDGS